MHTDSAIVLPAQQSLLQSSLATLTACRWTDTRICRFCKGFSSAQHPVCNRIEWAVWLAFVTLTGSHTKSKASVFGSFLLTLQHLMTPRKRNHPLLQASVHQNGAHSTACNLSQPICFVYHRLDSLYEFCVQQCL